MFIFKGCSRCRGELFQGSDLYGDYMVCLQCGYYPPDSEMMELLGVGGPLWAEEADQVAEPALVV